MKNTEYLCKCNNCDTIMFDENPQINAIKLPIPIGTVNMIMCDNDIDETHLGCPNCNTDDYLMDL